MQQTGYKGITSFSKGLNYDAGWREFFYTPIENIAVWPSILPDSQECNAEPQLAAGKSWYGPIKVANQQLGYKEEQQRSGAGIYYRVQVEGIYPGDGRSARVNLENMPHHKYVIIGKQRAGGLYLLLGAPDCGLDFNHSFYTGKATVSAGNEFTFSAAILNKPLILPSFGSGTTTPMPGATPPPSGEVGDGSNQTEYIEFSNTNTLTIPWTNARKQIFGIMPTIEVWFNDSTHWSLANVPIRCDQAPPSTTLFTIDLTGITDGFVVLK